MAKNESPIPAGMSDHPLAVLIAILVMPRIKQLKHLNFYKASHEESYQHINDLFTEKPLDFNLVETHYHAGVIDSIQFLKSGLLRYARKDGGVWIALLRSQRRGSMDCFATLAKTGGARKIFSSAWREVGFSSDRPVFFIHDCCEIKLTTKPGALKIILEHRRPASLHV